jgi:hypothetical protein
VGTVELEAILLFSIISLSFPTIQGALPLGSLGYSPLVLGNHPSAHHPQR